MKKPHEKFIDLFIDFLPVSMLVGLCLICCLSGPCNSRDDRQGLHACAEACGTAGMSSYNGIRCECREPHELDAGAP